MDMNSLLSAVRDVDLALRRSGAADAADCLAAASIVAVEADQLPYPEVGFACIGNHTIQLSPNATSSPVRLREVLVYAGSELSVGVVPQLLDERMDRAYRSWKRSNIQHLEVVVKSLQQLRSSLSKRRMLSATDEEYLAISIDRARVMRDTTFRDLSVFELRVSAKDGEATQERLLEVRYFLDFPEEWRQGSPVRHIHEEALLLLEEALVKVQALQKDPNGVAVLTIPPLGVVWEM